MSQQSLLKCIYIASELGFEQASQTQLPKQLELISPIGGTNMRDAIALGTSLMIKFREASINLGVGNIWNFVHIVLTDGADTGSSISSYELKNCLSSLASKLPREFLKTIYIGIDLDRDQLAQRELQDIADYGQSELYNASSNEINEIFDRIKVTLGLITHTRGAFAQDNYGNQIGYVEQQRQGAILIEKQRYMVLFNIDISGSMQYKWFKVCNAVNQFLKQLGEEDLVCGIVFNDTCKILTGIRTQQQQNQHIYQPRELDPCIKKNWKTIALVVVILWCIGFLLGVYA